MPITMTVTESNHSYGYDDPFGDGSTTPVEIRPPTRTSAYTPFIPPTNHSHSSLHDPFLSPQTPLPTHHTSSQHSSYATPNSTGTAPDYFHQNTGSYTSATSSRISYAPAMDRSQAPTPINEADEDDWYLSDAGQVLNRSTTLSPDNSVSYDIENRPSPRRSPMRKNANQKPKWIPTLTPIAPSLASTNTGSSSLEPPGTPLTTRHFGSAPPGRAHRRNKVLKEIKLTKGNLVTDLDVPPQMVIPYKSEPEMNKTRFGNHRLHLTQMLTLSQIYGCPWRSR
jgi:chitin synthase